MAEQQKSVPLSVVITVVISLTIGVGGLASAAVARTESLRMETALKQEERLRYLEGKSSAREEQFKALGADLSEIKKDMQLLLQLHPRGIQ